MVTLKWTSLGAYAKRPEKAHPHDAGWDLFTSYYTVCPPGDSVDVPTSIAVEIPPGFYGHIIGRSSTFRKHKLHVYEAVIDSGYRGELYVQVFNPGEEEVAVYSGQRLGQLIILPVPLVEWVKMDELAHSERGKNGFGSTGT